LNEGNFGSGCFLDEAAADEVRGCSYRCQEATDAGAVGEHQHQGCADAEAERVEVCLDDAAVLHQFCDHGQDAQGGGHQHCDRGCV
jgi:hypothetical protein